ncbi:hypothetical protein [Micromonospora fulviviridis]|uniref:Uncharacterized protein n=1 Tax=Micromonospora fulviviridis TaxID=47860 RepID=A0ABV2VEA7_9ACTN
MLNFLTLPERNTYASANGLALLVAVITVNGLAAAGGNLAIISVLAVVAGLTLAGWSRLLYSLIDAGNRSIGPLVGLVTVAMLLAAWAAGWPLLLGIALLLVVCWLPFMAAEAAGQALRVRAYWSNSERLWQAAKVAQTVIDAIALGATAVLLAGPWDGPVPLVRLAATLLMLVPLLLSRAADRSGPIPRILFWPTPGEREAHVTRPADEPQQQ